MITVLMSQADPFQKKKKPAPPGKMVAEQENEDSDSPEDFADDENSEGEEGLDNKLLDVQVI